MRRALAACAAVLVGSPAVALADDEPPPPKPWKISARLDGDTARFDVRYLVHSDGPLNAREPGVFGLPVRGLVTAATVTEGGTRHVLELMPVEEASNKIGELYEKMPGRARRWAVLLEADQGLGGFSIQTAAARQATFALDVEIAAPTCFWRDARYVAVPAVWAPKLPAEMRAKQAGLEDVCADEHDEHFGAETARVWMKLAAGELAARRGGAARIGTHAGRLALGDTQVAKLEIDLAARVSDVPADLLTAIVIDVSRSMTPEQLDAQRETIAAYLRTVPRSRVQVIAYSRRARALLPSWMLADQAATRVERELRAIARSNGSAIDAGLREAGKWLDQTTGTRRILLFTDENLASRSERAQTLDDALPAATLVHTIALGGSGLARDDEAKLARLAAKTRGMSVRGGELDENAHLDATLLARPITLDRATIRAPGWKLLATERACPDGNDDSLLSLAEGDSCAWWATGGAAAPITVDGWLWGEHVVRVVRADQDRSREIAREVSTMRVLEDELQTLAERAARAVNNAWSLYASWGGEDGYADGFGFGRSGFGTCGCGNPDPGTIGSVRGFLTAPPDLEAALSRIARTCNPREAVDLEVETTFEEIVDVEVTAPDAATRTCVEEALWGAWLIAPGAPDRTVTKLRVKPV